jgi:hypothetical protein
VRVRATVLACVAVGALAACGSSSKSTSSTTTVTPTTRAVTSTTSGTTDPKYSAYIGLTADAATAKATDEHLVSRVIEIDGVPQPATMDFNPERLNFHVNNNKVTKVTTG